MEIIRDYTKPIMNKNILTFRQPEMLTGGTYFTKILYNNNPLYIQTPKCKTKHGFIKSNKKIYTELLFTNSEEDMLGWFEQLDEYCKEFMLLKSSDWFNSSLTKEDIDNVWTSTLKLYKSGKNTLIKVNVPMEDLPIIKIYDDNERIKEMDDVNENTTIQTILEICGIRFTSRSYQLNIELKQLMIINNIFHPIFNKCLIKPVYMEKLSKEVEDDLDINIPNITNIQDIQDILEVKDNVVLGNMGVSVGDLNIEKSKDNMSMVSVYTEDINGKGNGEGTDNVIKLGEMSDFLTKNIDLEPIDLEPIEIDNLGINISEEDIKIKDPLVIYLEMYNDRLSNAKKLLYESKVLFQEAKQIKEKYKLDTLEDINGYISD